MEKLKYIIYSCHQSAHRHHTLFGEVITPSDGECTSFQGYTGLLIVTKEHISGDRRNIRKDLGPDFGP